MKQNSENERAHQNSARMGKGSCQRRRLLRFYGDTSIVIGQGTIKAHKGKQDLRGKYVWTDTFVKRGGEWKAVVSHVTPVLKG